MTHISLLMTLRKDGFMMKFNLKRIASVVIVAFLLTIMPKATLAADVNFNLQSANSDNSVVTIGYNNAYPSYYYKIALASQSSRQVAAGTFDQASGTITLTRANAPELSNLRSNDSLIITVYNPYNGYATVSESRLNIQAGAKKPSSMRILTSRLMANQNNQNLEIAFDNNYLPGAQDRINLYPLDISGNVIRTLQRQVFDISASNLKNQNNEQVASLNVSVPQEVKSYRVVFTSGNEELSNLTKTLLVGEVQASYRRLIIDFPTTSVGLGDTIKVRVFAEDTNGKKVDISGGVDLSLIGNAVRSVDNINHSFSIHDNIAYLNENVRLTARYQGLAQEVTLKVVKEKVSDPGSSLAGGSTGHTLEIKNSKLHTGTNTIPVQVRDEKGQNKALSFVPTSVSVTIMDTNNKITSLNGRIVDSSKLNTTGEGTIEVNLPQTGAGRLLVIFKGANPIDTYTVTSQNLTIVQGDGKNDTPAQTTKVKSVILYFGANSIIVDGKAQSTDTLPVIKAGRTYVPLRTVAQAFGAKVDWDQKTKTASAILSDTTIKMTLGQKTYLKNNASQPMDAACYIDKTGRTMVPVRYMSEAFGYKVNYDKVQVMFSL